jgi:type I restriction enzyme, S subunit
MTLNKKIHQLPKGWEWRKLGELCHTTSGGTPSRRESKFYEGNIPWVKSGELDKGVITDTEEKISEEAIKNSSAKLFPKGTLLIALYGATIGKLAFLGVDAATNQAICGIYKNEKIDSPFLYNYLLYRKQKLVNQGIGGAQPNISQSILRDLDIPLPPKHTQQAIVSKIEELFSELDKGIENLRLTQQQLKTYRQSVLKWAFEGRLTNGNVKKGELPKEWKWVKLGDVSILITKGASPKWQGINYVDDSSQVLFVTSENVRENYIDISTPKYLELSFNQKQKRSILKKGDVLLNIVGASIGRAAIYNLEFNANINQAVSVIRLSEEITNKFVSYYLNSNKALNYYNLNKVDFARANLSLADVGNVELALPPIDEQNKIVQEIESRLSVADKMEESITQSLQQAEALRQSILKKAFEGKLT